MTLTHKLNIISPIFTPLHTFANISNIIWISILFTTRISLHMETHNEQRKKFKCEVCKKEFARSDYLPTHTASGIVGHVAGYSGVVEPQMRKALHIHMRLSCILAWRLTHNRHNDGVWSGQRTVDCRVHKGTALVCDAQCCSKKRFALRQSICR